MIYLFKYSHIKGAGSFLEEKSLQLPILDENVAIQLAELFRALSDPSRVRILAVLVQGPLNVGALAEQVGLSESAVSHQLRGLRHMRIVRAHKRGRQVFYQLDDEHIFDLYRMGLDHVLDS
jgi:ArsR family transcriptional regulator, lead/cadmium/zinc/bismuth-responsive transcriptional repressor